MLNEGRLNALPPRLGIRQGYVIAASTHQCSKSSS